MEQMKMFPRIDPPAYSRLLEKFYVRLTYFTPSDRILTECKIFTSNKDACDFYDQKIAEGFWTTL